jgi:hypothetical protein
MHTVYRNPKSDLRRELRKRRSLLRLEDRDTTLRTDSRWERTSTWEHIGKYRVEAGAAGSMSAYQEFEPQVVVLLFTTLFLKEAITFKKRHGICSRPRD